MKQKLIAHGAEAKVFLIGEKIVKKRVPKAYRQEDLDKKLRKKRTKAESKILQKAKKIKANVPAIISKKDFEIVMERIRGEKLSEFLDKYPPKKQMTVMEKFGRQVKILHENDIIHSDLTTSNAILKGKDVFLIDFGLSFVSRKIEDKAVDLHLLKQALEAKHFKNHERLFQAFLKGYSPKEQKKILERLKIVENRGRYKRSKP
ncbi:Kae1-associated serine/threonine protein kinase [Candidatus Pacearchaeota archaeon]|nr:MAG: Kae1-associated serine/threonine protein kinase [Candidatus Pacearchaeota archaeon]